MTSARRSPTRHRQEAGGLIAEFRTSPMRASRHRRHDRDWHGHQTPRSGTFHALGQVRSFFEQMKGRGVRVINDDDLKAVTPMPRPRIILSSSMPWACASKTRPIRGPWKRSAMCLSRNCSVRLLGNIEPEVISSIAVRMARLEKHVSKDDVGEVEKLSEARI